MTGDAEYSPEAIQPHPMMRPVRGPRPQVRALAQAWDQALGIPPRPFTYYPTVEAR